MTLNAAHIAGALITLILTGFAGVYSGKKVKSAKDFALGGGNVSSPMVAGAIIGTLVGGSSTIATSQLAFTYGFSAIWFCLGSGFGCLFLALFFVKPMRESGCLTLQQMIQKEYGPKVARISSVLGILGIFLNIIAQLLSSMALISSIIRMPAMAAALISALLMIGYVAFGGIRGAGTIGMIKTVGLYVCSILCVYLIFSRADIAARMFSEVPKEQYYHLFARGIGTDGGAALSLIVGVLSTQTYAQSVLSAKSNRAAVEGALASAVLIPPLGACAVFIGIYMKILYPDMNAAQTFPRFLMLNFPDAVAGVFMAILLIAIIGCGAGLTLGISSIITANLLPDLTHDPKKKLLMDRISVIAVLLAAMLFTAGDLQSVILHWSFMSMGLRGSVVFLPLIGALFLRGKIAPRFALVTIITAPLCIIAGKFLKLPFDPLFAGLLAGFVIMAAGYIRTSKTPARR